ncbi:hypothetical protein CYMTET_11851 [Cymbomonas tetramitiformis]|uniref:Uncharacterized protein n=1 Tax=Cymbomonas tetramitiformis TaxID=36881 RepID=A0AAE0GLJ2_9CHLO|nr:hypothetical protein CYMTET_11851 [Cymbomonas tetramitiformis]
MATPHMRRRVSELRPKAKKLNATRLPSSVLDETGNAKSSLIELDKENTTNDATPAPGLSAADAVLLNQPPPLLVTLRKPRTGKASVNEIPAPCSDEYQVANLSNLDESDGSSSDDSWDDTRSWRWSTLPTFIPQKLREIHHVLNEDDVQSPEELLKPFEGVLEHGNNVMSVIGRTAVKVTSLVDNAIEGGLNFLQTAGDHIAEASQSLGSPTAREAEASISELSESNPDFATLSATSTSYGGYSVHTLMAPEQKAKRLESMLDELQDEMKNSQVECKSLRSLIGSLQNDLREARDHCEYLQKKNSALKNVPPATPSTAGAPEAQETLEEQARKQMESLLSEKAKLAYENMRLSRENESLQELLEYRFMDVEEKFCSPPEMAALGDKEANKTLEEPLDERPQSNNISLKHRTGGFYIV